MSKNHHWISLENSVPPPPNIHQRFGNKTPHLPPSTELLQKHLNLEISNDRPLRWPVNPRLALAGRCEVKDAKREKKHEMGGDWYQNEMIGREVDR